MRDRHDVIWKLAGASGAAGLAMMAIAAGIATSASQARPIWWHDPTMYVAYGFITIAVGLGARALEVPGHGARAAATSYRFLASFLPTISLEIRKPKRRLFGRKSAILAGSAERYIAVGKQIERAAVAGIEMRVEDVTPKRTTLSLHPASAPRENSMTVAEALAMPVSESECNSLIAEGDSLKVELLEARLKPALSFPGGSAAVNAVGKKVRDWSTRVGTVVNKSTLPFARKVEHRVYQDPAGLLGIGGSSVNELAEVIENNLSLLSQIRRDLK